MTPPLDRPITILGGGVLGLTAGLSLVEAGADVTVVDFAHLGANASGVAAGMVAPASEALGDPRCFGRLKRARELWPELADKIGASLDRSGAVHLGSAAQARRRLTQLGALGALAVACDAPAWVEARLYGVHTPDDWRLDASTTLERLQAAFLTAGGRWSRSVELAACREGQVVIAAGFGAHALTNLAPELRRLAPIKGQIIRIAGGPAAGAVVRWADRYFVPHPAGLIVGATMQPGVADTIVEDEALDALQRSAGELAPPLARMVRAGAAGVRATTPDAWPMVGASRRPGIWLATGARRNGWLLAPLIARTLVAAMRGDARDADAQAFDPERFDCA